MTLTIYRSQSKVGIGQSTDTAQKEMLCYKWLKNVLLHFHRIVYQQHQVFIISY